MNPFLTFARITLFSDIFYLGSVYPPLVWLSKKHSGPVPDDEEARKYDIEPVSAHTNLRERQGESTQRWKRRLGYSGGPVASEASNL